MNRLLSVVTILLMTAAAVYAVGPIAGIATAPEGSSFGWDDTNNVWRGILVDTNGNVLSSSGASTLAGEIDVTASSSGTFAVTLSNTPKSWVITNLDSTDTIYYVGATGDADANDYQILPGMSLSGNAAQTTFQFYSSAAVTVQIYAEY